MECVELPQRRDVAVIYRRTVMGSATNPIQSSASFELGSRGESMIADTRLAYHERYEMKNIPAHSKNRISQHSQSQSAAGPQKSLFHLELNDSKHQNETSLSALA